MKKGSRSTVNRASALKHKEVSSVHSLILSLFFRLLLQHGRVCLDLGFCSLLKRVPKLSASPLPAPSLSCRLFPAVDDSLEASGSLQN